MLVGDHIKRFVCSVASVTTVLQSAECASWLSTSSSSLSSSSSPQQAILKRQYFIDNERSSTFTPLMPPAIPLAVKSPYVNAILPAGGEHGNGGYLAGSWARHWPVSYGPSDKGFQLGWSGLIKIDDQTYEFLGDPINTNFIGTNLIAKQIAFEYTATKSIFTFKAGDVDFKVIFLSPVTPNDYARLSIPLSYMSVEVDPSAVTKHSISIYSDINGDWASGDPSAELVWDYTIHSGAGMHEIKRKKELVYAEYSQQAEWGSAMYATELRDGVIAGSGEAVALRAQFVKHGRLTGSQDVDYRSGHDREPVFGFSVKLSEATPSAVFTVGHMRTPYINYVTPKGQVNRQGFWATRFSSIYDVVAFFVKDFSTAVQSSYQLDATIRTDAKRVSGDNYAAIVELSTRQAFATFELTVGDREDDMMAFLKEISSNGDISTVDVIFPMYPILQYLNPTLIPALLEPLMQYSVSGLYPNRWTVHDLGTYPNATGYNAGNDEPMPVEEAGNMLWMILAYWQVTRDTAWVEKYFDILTQWTTFLIEDGLIPAHQLSTDDFAGPLSNQTNLAVKAIVGIGAMGKLCEATGRWPQSIHYKATAKAYVKQWTKMAMKTSDSELPHAKLAYQEENSWGLLYNLFGDRVLNLGLFDDELYKAQTAWYVSHTEEYGVPLDSRHMWTKTDWQLYAAASTTDAAARDGFVDLIVKYLKASKVDAAFPDLYETNNAKFPGRDGQDWYVEFVSRPVVGGHFSLLALDLANKVNGVTKDPFGGSGKAADSVAAYVQQRLPGRIVPWQG